MAAILFLQEHFNVLIAKVMFGLKKEVVELKITHYIRFVAIKVYLYLETINFEIKCVFT